MPWRTHSEYETLGQTNAPVGAIKLILDFIAEAQCQLSPLCCRTETNPDTSSVGMPPG